MFENDVNQYGYLTYFYQFFLCVAFENDVNQYGYLTLLDRGERLGSLRMM